MKQQVDLCYIICNLVWYDPILILRIDYCDAGPFRGALL